MKEDLKMAKLGIMKAKGNHQPVNFRMPPEDLSKLNSITKDINALTRTRISRCIVIQALIHIADDMEPEELWESIKEIL